MKQSLAPALAASAVFLALSLLMIPQAGIQDDEVLFTTPLYLHINKEFRVQILHHDVYMMITSYIGALKTALFAPVFWLFGAGPWSLRLPVAILGAITVFIFFYLTDEIAGRWAALAGAFLLATEPVFLLTNSFDWGPVAIEHVLLVTALWALWKMARSPATESGQKYLILGCFCLGLALWNKAIFLWALSGLAAGTLAVFPRELRALATRRNLRIGAGALLVGMLPLLIYNVGHKDATLRENARLDLPGVGRKWIQVEQALDGASLFGYMVSEEWRPQPKPVGTAIGRASFWLRERLGARYSTGFYYVLGILIAAVPLWWRSRAARFSLVFMAVTWLAMAMTRDAGGAAHHVILLWPFPVLFAAIALSRLAEWRAGRWPAAALAVVLVALHLVVLNQYLVQFERNGPAETFTDAIQPLSEQVAAFRGRPIYAIDWGIQDVLAFLNQGRLDVRAGNEPLMSDTPPPGRQALLKEMLGNREAVFLGHVDGEEMFPQVNQRLERAASAAGLRKVVLSTVADSNGRPRFEIFRLARAEGD
jgi:4-amino-4-deoxy-L-arabinose transferase-like glycosyltransferase